VFLHVFPKNRKPNLTKSKLAMYLKAAQELEKLTEKDFLASVNAKGWRQLGI